MDVQPLLFATKAYPLRASSLPKLSQCQGSVMLDPNFWAAHDEISDEGGGEAAQTGNLVHAAADAFHRTHNDLEAGLAALELARTKFPLGRPEKAERHFRAYAADKDNLEAEIVKCETKVTFTIPCAPFDPTGEPIHIKGTLDQIRKEKGRNRLWDIKTGENFYGPKALKEYQLQQAAYVLGAEETYGFEVDPGGLICTHGYMKQSKVFFNHWWSREDCLGILWPVAVAVAVARMGKAIIVSGDQCGWCVHKRDSNCRLVGRSLGLC